MSSAKRLRSPFILTLSTLTVAAACGNEVTTFGDGTTGGGGTTSSGNTTGSANGSTSGSTTAAVTVGVAAGGGVMPNNCPAIAPSPYEECTLDVEGVCTYPVACQSGTVAISFTCSPEQPYWRVVEQPCDFEYDSCPGTQLYCSGTWWMPEGTNPPSPCPEMPPQENTQCFVGKMGGVHERCGYPCEDDASSGWQVATCAGDFQDAEWVYDDACAP